MTPQFVAHEYLMDFRMEMDVVQNETDAVRGVLKKIIILSNER